VAASVARRDAMRAELDALLPGILARAEAQMDTIVAQIGR
jgi:hypothetical protein